MGDSAVIILGSFVATIIMFVFPLMTMADKKDDVSQLSVQTAVTEFTNDVRTTAYLTQAKYDNLLLTLAATGNAYDVDITVQKLDENPAKKVSGSTIRVGESVYYTMFTTQVLESLPLALNEGDIVTVNVRNTNTTIASQLRNFMYKVTGNSSANIVAQESGIVTKATAN